MSKFFAWPRSLGRRRTAGDATSQRPLSPQQIQPEQPEQPEQQVPQHIQQYIQHIQHIQQHIQQRLERLEQQQHIQQRPQIPQHRKILMYSRLLTKTRKHESSILLMKALLDLVMYPAEDGTPLSWSEARKKAIENEGPSKVKAGVPKEDDYDNVAIQQREHIAQGEDIKEGSTGKERKNPYENIKIKAFVRYEVARKIISMSKKFMKEKNLRSESARTTNALEVYLMYHERIYDEDLLFLIREFWSNLFTTDVDLHSELSDDDIKKLLTLKLS